ncbi:MAG: hypothetical protein ACRDWS_12015 [Acidimicrobiia bacterium]
MEQDGLIEPLPTTDPRTPYRLTRAGKAALTAELASLERLVDSAKTRLATT